MLATLKKNVAAVKSTVNDNVLKAAVMASMLVAGAAQAQETDPFTTAVAAMTTKITGYGGALVAFAAVSVGFLIAIKYVKKIPRSA